MRKKISLIDTIEPIIILLLVGLMGAPMLVIILPTFTVFELEGTM